MIVVGLTAVIAVVTQKKSSLEVVFLFFKVTLGVMTFAGIMAGVVYLLKIFGIAEEGFVL